MACYNYVILQEDLDKDEEDKLIYPDARDISKAIEWKTDAGIEAKVDTFSFTVDMANLPTIDGLPADIQPEDLIKIYVGNSPVAQTSANLVMDGKVDKITNKYGIAGRTIQANGVNRLEALLSSLRPFAEINQIGTVDSVSGDEVTVTLTNTNFDVSKHTDMTILFTSGDAKDLYWHVASISGVSGAQATLTLDGGTDGININSYGTPDAEGVAAADTFALCWNAPKAIENVVSGVNGQNVDGNNPDWKEIQWASSNSYLNSFGFAFRPISYAQPYKSAFQQIEELSNDEYTGDGTYIYYLDMTPTGAHDFIWKSRPTAIQTTIFSTRDLGSGYEPGVTVRAEHASFDVVNAVIIDAGIDFNGNSVFALAYNLTSIGKLGFKWKFAPYTELSQKIKEKEDITIDNTHPYGDVADWADVCFQGAPKESGDIMAVANKFKREYSAGVPGYTTDNAGYRKYLRDVAELFGVAYTDKLGGPRWKVGFEIRGNLSYTLGNKHEFEIADFGWTDINRKQLRIVGITQHFSRNGWTTTINAEEDEETALSDFKQKYGG